MKFMQVDLPILAAVITLSTLLLPATAQAERWYQVEVFVFKNLKAVGVGGEEWGELETLPDFNGARELLAHLPDMSDEPLPFGGETPMAFRLLDYRDRRLVGLEDKLESSDEYAPLLFKAWRQPSPKNENETKRPTKVKLAEFTDQVSPAETTVRDETRVIPVTLLALEGVVTVRIGRYINLDLDFVYYHEGQPVRLTESRKVKLNETHYFDHPLFGVIVELSPYDLPEIFLDDDFEISGESRTPS